MHLQHLPPEEPAVRRYVEDLWLPFHRDLEATVDDHALAGDVDLVAEELAFRLDRLDDDDYRAWVAVDDAAGGATTADTDGDDVAGDFDLATVDADLAGFVTTEVDEAPSVFDRPDRLVIGDIYVTEPYRGTGLARDLVERAVKRARATGCAALVLDVDAGNERALAFYEKLGFETLRYRKTVDVEEL